MVKKGQITVFLIAAIGLFVIIVVSMIFWVTHMQNTVAQRMSGKRWSAPTEFYAAPERFVKGQAGATQTIESTLRRLDYLKLNQERSLRPGEYTFWNTDICQKNIDGRLDDEVSKCLAIKPRPRPDDVFDVRKAPPDRPLQVVALTNDDILFEVYEGNPPTATHVIEMEPELFAQFYGGQAVMRKIVTLGDVPPQLLNAIMAIEDSDFLKHHGVSWTGMVRAALRNILKGRVSEGGSTITQQLIKNYFLTSQRTFKRKIKEIFMALIIESQFTKDDILETYINEVYLGQVGSFEIHGVGVASQYLFHKRPEDMTLAECALMAGTIRGPNLYSPFSHPDRSRARRDQVLKRMVDLELISQPEYDLARQEALPQTEARLIRDSAPFFVDSVKLQLKELKISDEEGLQVFTTLNQRAQTAATDAVIQGLNKLETQFDFIQKREAQLKQKLQAVLISADPTNGFVQAVVGGRSYGETQLNRALQSQRQVGSVFKPFVYLTAFDSKDEKGQYYTPLTLVDDSQFTANYDRQSWTPRNYDDDYEGIIPLYRGLQGSLNAATSRVAIQIGIKKVAKTAEKLGLQSPMMAVPSLALGSAGLTPFEVLQAYSTLARKGEYNPLTFVYRVMTSGREIVYEYKPRHTQVVDAVNAAETVALMEGVINRGTGRGVRAAGFTHPAAGKTGTTNDKKDTWFAGFTPLHAAVVWVGFDLPESTGLTGALGGVPIWTQYMKTFATKFPPIEFGIPDGAVKLNIDVDWVKTMASQNQSTTAGMMVPAPQCQNVIPLVFKKGLEPSVHCP